MAKYPAISLCAVIVSEHHISSSLAVGALPACWRTVRFADAAEGGATGPARALHRRLCFIPTGRRRGAVPWLAKHELYLIPIVHQPLLNLLQSVRLLANVDECAEPNRPSL